MDITSNCLLCAYPYSHRWVELSPLIREASYSRWQLTPRPTVSPSAENEWLLRAQPQINICFLSPQGSENIMEEEMERGKAWRGGGVGVTISQSYPGYLTGLLLSWPHSNYGLNKTCIRSSMEWGWAHEASHLVKELLAAVGYWKGNHFSSVLWPLVLCYPCSSGLTYIHAQ